MYAHLIIPKVQNVYVNVGSPIKAGLRSRSREEPHVFGPLEPEPLEEKKQEAELEPRIKKIGSQGRKKYAAPRR